MAGFKATRGQRTHNWKKMLNGVEIKPWLYVCQNGKKIMGGSVDGEMVVDENGKVLPFRAIQHDSLA